jgi:uncharacterized protein (DUF1800 family)
MMDGKINLIKIKHLYNRAGFGVSYGQLNKLSGQRIKKVVNELVEERENNSQLAIVSYEEYNAQQLLLAELKNNKEQNPEEKSKRTAITKVRNAKSRQLNVAWMQQMINTKDPLKEKMTLFWHGHFACRSNNPYFAQQLNNIQREHALGNFKQLLIAVSQSPAMLDYLNNQQNRKGRPNENFSRELMELFTMGRGNYSERDVKEAARAFTGWSYNKEGQFEFKHQFHDEKEKTFMGKTGLWDGEAIINLILEKPETAVFICRKLYTFFVNDVPEEKHVKELATFFYAQHYDITAVMRYLFNAEWFYQPENIGNKIKSPIDFIVNMSRQFHVSYAKPDKLIQLQTSLGQYLFNPPNVAGWSGGKNWIDSSSLMLRMKIPSLVLNDGILDFDGKSDPEDEAIIALNDKTKQKAGKSLINAQADWTTFLAEFPKDMSQLEFAVFILSRPLNQQMIDLISKNVHLKNTALAVTSMPEYQLY